MHGRDDSEPALSVREMTEGIEKWVASRTPGSAGFSTSKDDKIDGPTVITLTPRKPEGCRVIVEIADRGPIGVYCGRGIRFEEFPRSLAALTDLFDAVERGKVSEKLWLRSSRVVRWEGAIETRHGPLFDRGSTIAGWLLLGAVAQEVRYEPWT